MAFLAPLFLIGAVVASVPLILHLLKRQPEPRVKFSSVRLLRSAPIEHTDRRRLNDLLLLALRMTALVLLAIAFARPFVASGGRGLGSGVTVIALDTSLSMSAPGRFERAQTLAKQAVDQAAPGGLVSVMTFADGAHVEIEPTTDRALARSTIDAAAAGFGSTSYRSALNTGAELLGGRPGTIVIVTDLQESGWDNANGSVPESTELRLADVGQFAPNLAVTDAKVTGNRIVANVRNTGLQVREARVHLRVEGTQTENGAGQGKAADATVTVGPGQSVEVPFPAARGRWASVVVDDPDGIEGDNTRYIVLDGAARPVVLVVTPTGELERDAFYVQQGLSAARSDGSAYVVEGVAGEQLAKWSSAELDAYRAVVVVSTRGLERHGRDLIAQYIRGGGGVLVAAGAGVDGDVLTEALGIGQLGLESQADRRISEVRHLLPLDARHPVFEPFREGTSALALVKFARVTTLRASECQTIARFNTGEAALADCVQGQGRTLLLAADLNNQWNDFPLHSSFVPFLHQAVRYLSEGRRRSEYLVAEVPPGVAPRPGVVSANNRERTGERLIAVNVDPRESDPRRLTEEEFRATVTRVQETGRAARFDSARQTEGRQQLWRYLLTLMLATLILEGVVAARTA